MIIYLKQLLWAIPLLLIFGFIRPGPVDIKIQTSIAILVVILIPQLVSVLIFLRNERKRYARDVREANLARLHPAEEANTDLATLSRKERRRRARITEIQHELEDLPIAEPGVLIEPDREPGRLARLQTQIRHLLADTVDLTLSLESDPPQAIFSGRTTKLNWYVEEMSGEYLIGAEGTAIDAVLSPDDESILRFAQKVDRCCTIETTAMLGRFRVGAWWTLGTMPLLYNSRKQPRKPKRSWFGYRQVAQMVGECPDSDLVDRILDGNAIGFGVAGQPFYVRFEVVDGPDDILVEVTFNPEFVDLGDADPTDVIVHWGSRADVQIWLQELLGDLRVVLCPPELESVARTRLFGGEASHVANVDPTDPWRFAR
ncbi:hypothetical protein [Microbacterium sp. PMB16]|uniref:hypothetical protein n=1 Tax=Microbacterium sp. PMB16 TaxID=3120157 RepID=UPI003F4BBC74